MRLKWDGSYLGTFPTNIVIAETTTDKHKYVKLQFDGDIEICIVRKTENAFTCLVDELKPLFGLRKIGTHTIHLGKKLHQLTRPRLSLDETTVIEEVYLSEVGVDANINPTFAQQVQEIFCFRDLLGISATNESRIQVRFDTGRAPFPLSIQEHKSTLLKQKKPILSRVMLEKWFRSTSMPEVLMRILHVDQEDVQKDYTAIQTALQRKIEEVVHRVDSGYVWFINCILARINDRLTSV